MYDIGTNDKWSGSSQQFGALQLIDSLIKPSRGSVIFKHVKTQRQRLWVSPQEGQRPFIKWIINWKGQTFKTLKLSFFHFDYRVSSGLMVLVSIEHYGRCFWHISPFEEKCILFSSGCSKLQIAHLTFCSRRPLDRRRTDCGCLI